MSDPITGMFTYDGRWLTLSQGLPPTMRTTLDLAAHDAPTDTGDVEALAEIVRFSEMGMPRAGVHQDTARAVLASDWLAARDAAQRADERERIAQAIEAHAERFGDPADNAYEYATIARAGTAACEPECSHPAWTHIGSDRYCAACGVDRDTLPAAGGDGR